MSEQDFSTLSAFEQIPDSIHEYVRCRFYNKDLNIGLFVRRDITIYQHQVFRFEHGDIKGFVSTKEVQRHPVNSRIIHIDFFVIPENFDKVDIMLPLKFDNRDKSAVIKLGGFINITSRYIRVKVDKASLVPYISIDISPFKSEESIALHHIDFPKGVFPVKQKLTVATMMPSKGAES